MSHALDAQPSTTAKAPIKELALKTSRLSEATIGVYHRGCFVRGMFNIPTLPPTAEAVMGMAIPKASRYVAGLLALTGIMGIEILTVDQVLRETALTHFYGLALFVVIDFIVAALVITKPTKTAFTSAAIWSLLRIIIQLADVYQAHSLGMRYTEFANYLFNPTLTTPPNPSGVPGAIIDLILLLELVVFVIAWRARSSTTPKL